MNRRAVFAVGLAASLAVTALLWILGVPGVFLFLLLPFLWFGGRASSRRRRPACPSCAAPSERGFTYCPACGARL